MIIKCRNCGRSQPASAWIKRVLQGGLQEYEQLDDNALLTIPPQWCTFCATTTYSAEESPYFGTAIERAKFRERLTQEAIDEEGTIDDENQD